MSVLVAPAGFGKTTLLAEWYGVLKNDGCTTAWLSLDREDDDLGQFAGYLLAAIEKALAEAGKGPRHLVRGDALTSINALLADMVNDLASSGLSIVVILDDYDRLVSPDIQETVFRLLRYAPDNLHIVLAGRSEPAIPLSYFAARDQLVRLDVEQLRFDAPATQEFFTKVSGIALDPGQAGSLIEATEGWVAGLLLASFTIKGKDEACNLARRLPRAQRSIDAYLSENVLIHAPDRIQDFLLRTSILDRLSPDLCNEVTGSSDASASIDWLVARNMFIRPLDEETGWFRYHALFSEYLRNRLAKELPGEAAALHRKASEWYAAQYLWSEAVKHALAAGDIEQATSWVEEYAMNQVEISDVATVLGWVSKLPPSALRSRIRLRVAQAWALALSLRSAESSQVLREIEADIANGLLVADHDMRTELTAVKSLIAGLSDKSAESLDLGRRTLEMQPKPRSWVEAIGLTTLVFGLSYDSAFDEIENLRRSTAMGDDSDPLYSTVYRESMFGLAYLVEGRLHEAVRNLEIAVHKANIRVGRHSAASVLPAGYLATIYYEWNDLAGVAQILQNRLETAIEACSLGPLIGFCIGSARMAALNGDSEEAERLIANAEAIAKSRNWLRMEVACKAEAIRLCIRVNDIERAVRAGRSLDAIMAGETASSQG